eukprot:CAMPEP_0202690836 /NCGR_PEP_ID=MMETSP1385-20130828/5726_1 /ASSEMBLY_ACC=CAM_ASM_000861 /TAXON_ID=933848 /ORGANISM="Elphidium margaritaceum" /LENGTH=423 /DNA_ID=CAMNT_0049346151 /DNA_START=96 /DNA_END=1365 /DNA_ORIENTATION=+
MAMDGSNECTRHRKPWHLLSDEERMQYVTGFQQLRYNGKLDIFIETHHLADTPTAFADVHYTAQFFPWHSYFLTEIESQIRSLGPEYECFGLPYWDFTIDSGYSHADDMPIYSSVLGADGNEDNDYCVEDALWNRDVYPTTYLCSENELRLNLNCCLKRHHGERGHIPDADTLASHIVDNHRWWDFQETVVQEHKYVHSYISGNVNKTHMFGHNAAEDPLFIMLHNFMMYIRALRTTCFGYDLKINELEQYQPFSYDPYQDNREADMKPFLDLPLDFNLLAEQEWSRAYAEDITVRKIFDIKAWDISFELGTFWHQSAELQKYCSDNLNSSWFYDSVQFSTPRREQHGQQDQQLSNTILDGVPRGNTHLQHDIAVCLFIIAFALTLVALCRRETIRLAASASADKYRVYGNAYDEMEHLNRKF